VQVNGSVFYIKLRRVVMTHGMHVHCMQQAMNVNAVWPTILFVLLMVVGLLASYLVGVHRGDVQAWIPYIR